MRASAQWHRRLSERFGPRESRRGVAHLRHYSAEYLLAGRGEPLLLVPGLAGGFPLLGRLIQQLAEHFQVICFEFRDEREAIPSRLPHTLSDLADDLADFQNALLLERPALAAVSFGSAVALQFAIKYPRQVDRMVLHGMAARFRDSLGGRIARLALELLPLPHDHPFFNQFFRLLFAQRESVGPLLDYVTACCWSTDQSVIAHRLGLLANFDVCDQLHDLKTPTLVLAGHDDSIVRASAQRQLAESVPHGRFMSLAGSGHLCFLTRARSFARHVSEFLAEVPVAAR